jgi:glyoxylase-like metal-dependent hydrolase (beta-lactamase superfamily II)
MELVKIKGNTYYIQAGTNIGVVSFKNKNCLVVDTTINNTTARKMDMIINENSLHVKYIINTHSHEDHCGGNNYFKDNYPGTYVYTSEIEKLYIDNPELFSMNLFSVPNSFKQLGVLSKSSGVDYILDCGINKINDEKFEIVDLPGHTSGLIGVITPERVCFTGDSIFSRAIIEKYKIPYFIDIEKAVESINKLKELDADYFVLGHASSYIDKSELLEIADLNISKISEIEEQILDFLDQPCTREVVLENILVLNDVEADFKEYFLNLSCISAYLSYFYKKSIINFSIEDGKIFFYKE